MSPEARNCIIFLIALTGESQTKIAEQFGMTKGEIHAIINNKLKFYGIVYTIKEFIDYDAWWKSVIRKELDVLWHLL